MEKGGLHITTDPVKVKPTVTNPENNDDFWSWLSSEKMSAGPMLQESLENMPIGDICAACQFVLEGAWGFYFGGAKEFQFSDVCFNKKGDLLATLNYYGT